MSESFLCFLSPGVSPPPKGSSLWRAGVEFPAPHCQSKQGTDRCLQSLQCHMLCCCSPEDRSTEPFCGHLELQTEAKPHPGSHIQGLHGSKLSQNSAGISLDSTTWEAPGSGGQIKKGSDFPKAMPCQPRKHLQTCFGGCKDKGEFTRNRIKVV